MLESYQSEVARKRRAARLFWLVVFVCSLFLYFFFLGYYPDVRVGLRHIFSDRENSSNTGSSDIMKSFGIINVRVVPLDSSITLGSGSYGNNEKRMSDYGNYLMSIKKNGYVTNTIEFIIDRDKPYFIEKVSLLPSPEYKKIPEMLDIYPMKNGEAIFRTASGYVFSGTTQSKSFVYSGGLQYIGGNYFTSGSGVLIWENGTFERANPTVTNFVRTCESIEWESELFYCPKSNSLLTEGGRYITGILDIRDSLIERSGSLIEVDKGTLGKNWNQIDSANIKNYITVSGMLYLNSSGSLIPEDSSQEVIDTSLDQIDHVSRLKDDLVFIGQKKGEPHILIWHSGDPIERIRDIPFPAYLSYSNIAFHLFGGNLIVETNRGILLIYRGSNEIHWIVEGDILSYAEQGAIYRKEDGLWSVNWREKGK